MTEAVPTSGRNGFSGSRPGTSCLGARPETAQVVVKQLEIHADGMRRGVVLGRGAEAVQPPLASTYHPMRLRVRWRGPVHPLQLLVCLRTELPDRPRDALWILRQVALQQHSPNDHLSHCADGGLDTHGHLQSESKTNPFTGRVNLRKLRYNLDDETEDSLRGKDYSQGTGPEWVRGLSGGRLRARSRYGARTQGLGYRDQRQSGKDTKNISGFGL